MATEFTEIPYQQIFENDLSAISVHTLVVDGAGRPVDYRFDAVNRGFESFTGLKAADILGKTVREVLPATEEIWIERYGRVALTGESQSFTSYSQEMGKWYAVSAFRHKPLGFTVSFLDITSIKRAEEQLQKSGQQFETMVRNMPVGVLLQGPQAEILMGNPRALELLGLTLDQLLGKTSFDPDWKVIHEDGSDFLGPSHPVPQAIAARAPVRDVVMGVFRPRTSDVVWLLVDAEPLLGDQGQVEQVVCTFIDISRRKSAEAERSRLQAQLQQSQKMENLGILAGGIAHDMNNVLAAILTLSSAKLMRLPDDDPHHHAFVTIAKAAERGGKMVKSLLEFARQSPAEEKRLDMNALIREEVGLLERTTFSRVPLVLDLAWDLNPILGDAAALAHVLMNLCVNAVDAMEALPSSGTLTLRTRNAGSSGVEVLVEDTGIGMTPDVLQRALDPFFTTKPVGKGTGLGLSLAYTTMQAHQGRLSMSSAPGQGTVVTLWFPAALAGTLEDGEAAASGALLGTRALSVLLIDDDELIRDSLSATLEAGGASVATVSGGQEALALVPGALKPDIIILDMNMPGLSGAETLGRLRALMPEVPVLLSTGRTDQTALNLVAAYSAVTLLPKPFSMEELNRQLDRIRPASSPERLSEIPS